MIAHAQTQADADLAAARDLGWRIRLVPNGAGRVELEAMKRIKGEPVDTINVAQRTLEEAARELRRYAEAVR